VALSLQVDDVEIVFEDVTPLRLVKENVLLGSLVYPIDKGLEIFELLKQLLGRLALLVGQFLNLGGASGSSCGVELAPLAAVLLDARVEAVEERLEMDILSELRQPSDACFRILALLRNEVLCH